MEIGSFIGLEIRESGEYYNRKENIARLNSARAGIYHACKLLECNSIHLPSYLCPTVKAFLLKNGIKIKSYSINDRLEPENLLQSRDHAVLLVNYFGLMDTKGIRLLSKKYKNVIIDNSSAFYCNPLRNGYSIYSPRKFFGVPDGCYVIGDNAERFTAEYDQDISSDTASFLLKSTEYGTGLAYSERMRNERRIDMATILNMSTLTKVLLRSIDYSAVRKKRRRNFRLAHSLFKNINLLNINALYGLKSVPMVYPLLIEDINLDEKLRKEKIYVGRLWKHVLNEVPESSIEARLSKYLIPIPIDQRYGKHELLYIYKTIIGH